MEGGVLPQVGAAPRTEWRARVALVAVLVVALIVRLAFVLNMEAYPRFELIRNGLDDQVFLDAWAKTIVRGEPFDLGGSPHEFAYWALKTPGVFPQAPLYPYYLAALYSLFGFHYDLVRFVQVLCGVAAVGFIFLTGRMIFGLATALVAALAAALYGPFVFHEATFLIDSLTVFFTALMLYLLVRLQSLPCNSRPSAGYLLVFGFIVGLAALLRPNFLLFGLAAMLWGGYRALPDIRRGLITLVCIGVGISLPLLPVVWVNSARSGSLAFISSNGPFLFFMGNLPDPIPGNSPTYLRLKERSRVEPVNLWAEAVQRIRTEPRSLVTALRRKVRVFFGGLEMPDNLNYYLTRQCNPALALAPLGFPAVLPFAALGIVLAVVNRQRVFLLLLFLALYTASVTLFVVQSRLRQPGVVVLLLCAAYAIVWCAGQIWERRPVRALLLLAAATAAAFFLRPHPDQLIRPVDYGMAGVSYRTLAMELEAAGRISDARKRYVRALVLNPADDQALARIEALALVASQSPNTAAETAPDVERLCNEARELADSRRYDEAADRLEQALRVAPASAVPYHYLANVYYLRGNHQQAIAALEEALARDPTNALFRENLKVLKGLKQ